MHDHKTQKPKKINERTKRSKKLTINGYKEDKRTKSTEKTKK